MASDSSGYLARCAALWLTLPAIFSVASCGPDWNALDPSLTGGAPSTVASSGGSAGGPSGSGASGGSSGGPAMNTIEYVASVADCVDPLFTDPDDCEDDTGAGTMSVDLTDTFGEVPNYSFVRFDIHGALVGRTVHRATLRMVVAADSKSSGPDSGEVWQVMAFTRDDLYSDVPEKVGSSPIAGSKGAVTQGQIVEWDIPVTLVVPNLAVWLGIYPVSDDGVGYSNLNGSDPPKLIVELL